MIADDNGNHPVKTVGGCVLQAKKSGNKITLTDFQAFAVVPEPGTAGLAALAATLGLARRRRVA